MWHMATQMGAGGPMRGAYLASQAGFNGKGFIQELFVEGLLWLMDHDDRHAMAIILRPTRTAHHLKYIGDGKIHIPPANVHFKRMNFD